MLWFSFVLFEGFWVFKSLTFHCNSNLEIRLVFGFLTGFCLSVDRKLNYGDKIYVYLFVYTYSLFFSGFGGLENCCSSGI